VVKAERGARNDTKGQGRPIEFPLIEPWPDRVDGAALLSETAAAITRYVVMPDGGAEIGALWATHTHCFPCFEVTPRLGITSPEKQCGKTTFNDVLSKLCPRPLPTISVTAAAVFRTVEATQPTLLIDEADTFLGVREELRGILNAGHRKGGTVIRTVGDDHEPRQFSVWAPVAISLIGQLPDTLDDRAIKCRLRRRKPSERVTSFRSDRVDHLHIIARKMARWTADHEEQLSSADPDMGDLQNRVADNWRPLFAIADLAGEIWPARVRAIASAADGARDDQSIRVQLLGDVKAVFEIKGTDRLSSEEIVEYLISLDDRAWVELRSGKPLTKAGLARLLNKFGIAPQVIRLPDGRTPRGYYRSAFEDAFERYLPPQSATPQQAHSHRHFSDFQSATPDQPVALSKSQKSLEHNDCCSVALSTPPPREEEGKVPPLLGRCTQCHGERADAPFCPSEGVHLHLECRRFWLADHLGTVPTPTPSASRRGRI
jgi:putative DNA primase/helicase